MNGTASMAFRLVPDSLRTQLVFLCIDDTIVPKSGTKFEDVSILFDYATHRGSSYLNGHCFVSLMLCVPVWKADKISWLSVPLGYRMWTKQKSKLELAADMIRQVMPECQKQKNVILLCDSWYMKKPLVSISEEYPNLDMIRTVRADSALYDLPPERTGRKGRPAGHGKQLLFFLIKRLTVILSPSARSLQICLAAGRYWHMSLPRNRKVEKKTFFQYGFSGTAADFLCLAVEGTHEPDRQYMDEIYSVVLL